MSAIDYSDGNVEKDIVNILKCTKNFSSDHMIASDQYGVWPIRYHLTSLRRNILRHLNFQGMSVLELGAGMGAVSRFIAEKASHLTIVEGSEQRFEAAHLRLGGLSNWDGVVSNYMNFKTVKKYDVVCLIGVLEYAGRYIKTENPFQTALEYVKSFLKPGGVVIIALENKNGIKYFNGIAEDHFGKPYVGICGYQVKKDIETFSLHEMKNLLKKAGLDSIVTHFPWPDYKLPKAVLTETFYNLDQELCANIASTTKFEDYMKTTKPLYPNDLALNSLAKSNLLDNMSNSFLFLASEDENSDIKDKLLFNELKNNEIGWLYSTERKFNSKTTFFYEEALITVKKDLFDDSTRKKLNHYIIQTTDKIEVTKGTPLNLVLLNHVYYKNWNEFLELHVKFFRSTFLRWQDESVNNLLPQSFDAISRNCILTEKGFEYFDLEFLPDKPFPKTHFLARSILNFYQENKEYFYESPYENLYSLYVILCGKFSLRLNIENDLKFEADFLNSILDVSNKFTGKYLEKIFFESFGKEKSKRHFFTFLNKN